MITNIITSDGFNIHERDDIPKDILARLEVDVTGDIRLELPKDGDLPFASALRLVEALRRVAKSLEAAVVEQEAKVWGEGGKA